VLSNVLFLLEGIDGLTRAAISHLSLRFVFFIRPLKSLQQKNTSILSINAALMESAFYHFAQELFLEAS